MQQFYCLFLLLITSLAIAEAPVDIKPECKNEAFEVNGKNHPILQGYYIFYGDEFLSSVEFIESLRGIKSCTEVVTKAETRYKRLEYFSEQTQKIQEPYKDYFIKKIIETNSKNNLSSKTIVVQQDIDQLVNTSGLSATEACAVVYGQWSWAAIDYSAKFSNRINHDLLDCGDMPLKTRHLTKP
jgi:hypothetical protein